MKHFYILLIFSLFISCSVKKNVVKQEVKEESQVKQSVSIKHSISDSITTISDSYEIEVVASDTLKPISVNLNGSVQTFSNAKKIVLRKKKESVIEAKNEVLEVSKDSVVNSVKHTTSLNKDVKRVNYSYFFILPFFVLCIIIFRKFIKALI